MTAVMPPMRVEILSYDPGWAERFAALGAELRGALGDVALRIHHIGSTAVQDLAAKPTLDVQISVASFDPLEAFKTRLETLNPVYRADNTERTRHYFRAPPGCPRTHIHVRRAGSFSEQLALVFRDSSALTLRPRKSTRRSSGPSPKRYRDGRHAYTEAKVPFFWDAIRKADTWAQAECGWIAGP
jgi:GrpB-like predicted nucleotidyltransferase (UPF0157 family)